MEIREVLKIVRNLADAMWPAMQNDPEDVARQQLEAVRALAKAVAALETEENSSMRKTYTRLGRVSPGRPWKTRNCGRSLPERSRFRKWRAITSASVAE